MEWFQLYVNDLSNRLLSAASSSAFGAWVRMLANCYRLENGGCYEHCSGHSSRQWMSIAQVDRAEVDEVVEAGLAAWENGGLRVHGYDVEQQQRATERKEKGREMALARWSHAASNAAGNAAGNAKERKGKEKKGEEKKADPCPAAEPAERGGAGDVAPLQLVPTEAEAAKARKPNRAKRDPEGFARFWAAYPKRVKKQNALAAWRHLEKHDLPLDAILTALEWQRKSDQWTEDAGKYIPSPDRYLSGRRWEDEPSAYPKTGKPSHDIRTGHGRPEDIAHPTTPGLQTA